MTSACIYVSGGSEAPPLRSDLEAFGVEVLSSLTLETLVREVIRSEPDVVVCFENQPDDALFAVTLALRDTAPRPVVLFTADPDAEKIERAAGAGVHAYVVNGYGPNRLRSVIHVAQARFRRDHALREELSDVQSRFSERKLVDRAKGILMRLRDVPEDDAFRMLRSAAMATKQRIGQVAQQVIDATRYADAVNRAGQFRMLSQRIVKLAALACAGVSVPDSIALSRESVVQAEANLAVLSRSLSKATFGDLLDGIMKPWAELKSAVTAVPSVARLREVDAKAERLLQQAEALTRNLESAGFAAALRIVNVSGRQRMLSQRIAKLAILSGLLQGQGGSIAAEIGRAEQAFAEGLAYLGSAPLSTGEIRAVLDDATATWVAFRRAVAAGPSAYAEVATLSEALLARFGDLTRLYEQGIQLLMG